MSRVATRVSWVLYPGGSDRSLAPNPILGGGGAAPLSQAGPAPRQAGVRAFTMVHLAWAPGLAIQPRTITAPQPLA